jgi:hypothetical protein
MCGVRLPHICVFPDHVDNSCYRRSRKRWSNPIRRMGTTRSMVTTVVPASVLGVVVLPLAGTTLVLLVLLEPSAGLGMGIGTVVLGVVDGVVVTGAVYTTRMARRSRIRASRPNRRAGVVVVTTVGTVGAAGAVAAGFGEGAVAGLPAGGSAAQTIALNPHTAATLNRDFIIVLPPETSCTSSDPGSTSSTQSIRCTQFSNPSWLCKAPKGKINMPQVIELEAP